MDMGPMDALKPYIQANQELACNSVLPISAIVNYYHS